jgi:hypothetical protein
MLVTNFTLDLSRDCFPKKPKALAQQRVCLQSFTTTIQVTIFQQAQPDRGSSPFELFLLPFDRRSNAYLLY